MRPLRKRIAHRLEHWAVVVITALIWPLGFRGAQKLGILLANTWYHLYGRRVDVTRANIRRAFPDLSDDEVEAIARESYRQIGMTFLEFAYFPYLSKDRLKELIRVEGADILDQVYGEGKGVVIVASHYGNWELFGAIIAYRYPMWFFAGTQSNPHVDARIHKLRAKMGLKYLTRSEGARRVPRVLKQGDGIGFAADQDARESGVFVDFLGTPASTARGPALYSVWTGAPIIFIATERQEDGTHIGRVYGPVRARPGADRKEEIERLTQEHADLLAAVIRRRPEQYFWQHRRWKTVPPKEEP